jgi:hypothetical protein
VLWSVAQFHRVYVSLSPRVANKELVTGVA